MSCDLLLSSASPLHLTILRAHRRLMFMLGPRVHQNHAIDQGFCYTTGYLPKLGIFPSHLTRPKHWCRMYPDTFASHPCYMPPCLNSPVNLYANSLPLYPPLPLFLLDSHISLLVVVVVGVVGGWRALLLLITLRVTPHDLLRGIGLPLRTHLGRVMILLALPRILSLRLALPLLAPLLHVRGTILLLLLREPSLWLLVVILPLSLLITTTVKLILTMMLSLIRLGNRRRVPAWSSTHSRGRGALGVGVEWVLSTAQR